MGGLESVIKRPHWPAVTCWKNGNVRFAGSVVTLFEAKTRGGHVCWGGHYILGGSCDALWT